MRFSTQVFDREALVMELRCVTTQASSTADIDGHYFPMRMRGRPDAIWITEIEKVSI
jgi:hypothetical protein